MQGVDLKQRQQALPIIHVKGSFYQVGFNVGRTFSGQIKALIATHTPLNYDYLPAYETVEGKEIYDKTYQCVQQYYPHYLRELHGISDGAGVPFYKLFLLHMDDVLPASINRRKKQNGCAGCSTVCINEPKQEIIGHTEDAFKDVLNNVYIVKATITESQPEENFTAFCYAGLLPGYAMGFNKHGLVYSINIISAKHLGAGKLPRAFVARALLTADTLENALTILRCKGCGIADAMSINCTFLNQDGDRLFHNIEVSPSYPVTSESALSVLTASPGEVIFHANKFIRLKIPENDGPMYDSSIARHETLEGKPLFDLKCVTQLLGNEEHPTYTIFRSIDPIWTVAVGIFDCVERTWSLYMDNPKTSEPIAVLPLDG